MSAAPARARSDGNALTLRRFGALHPRIIVIGASTGGPQALSTLLSALAPSLANVPVVIVLHTPASFTTVVAEHTARTTGLPVKEAQNGEAPRPGHVYFASGGVHLKIIKIGDRPVLAHSNAPPENFCRPAVDVLFRTAAEAYGPGVLGIVLTGMGSDGLAGAGAVIEAGGSIVAQDEASSVVWGMPGAVARAGYCAAVLPLDAMAGVVTARLRGDGPRR
jgi:two-component system chemotaxis response regulator CheB